MFEEETQLLIKKVNQKIEKRKGYFYKFTLLSIVFALCIVLGFVYIMIYIKSNDLLSPKSQELLHEYKTMKRMTEKQLPLQRVSDNNLLDRTQKALVVTSDEHKQGLHVMGRFIIQVSNGLYNDTLFQYVLQFETDDVPIMYIKAAVTDLIESLINDEELKAHKSKLQHFAAQLISVGNSNDNNINSNDDMKAVSMNMVEAMKQLKGLNKHIHDSIIQLERQITLQHIFNEMKHNPTDNRLKDLLYEVVQILKPLNVELLGVYGSVLNDLSQNVVQPDNIWEALRKTRNGNEPDDSVVDAAIKLMRKKLKASSQADRDGLAQYAELLFKVDDLSTSPWGIDMLKALARAYNEILLLKGPFQDFRYVIMQLFN